ncbi:MAG: PHP domain-containing protein [Asgard group archaeon]|nr:PHP domain-containing protein [Asgard group archaeon]
MNAKKRIINISIKYCISIVLLFLLAGVGVLLANYRPASINYTIESFNWQYDLDYSETEFNIVFDHHSHTKHSDGILTLEENILWHIAHGFNAMAISDHDTLGDTENLAFLADKYSSQIVVFQGMEWTTNRIHLNLIGITEYIPDQNNPTDEEIQAAIDATHDQSGIVVVNHIPWSLPRMPDHPTRAQLLDWGVDYIESVNEHDYDYDSDSWCNNTGGFGKITGTDMHHPMHVSGWTLMKADNFTTEGIMKELQLRNTEIIYDKFGSIDQSEGIPIGAYRLVEPLVFFGDYLANFDIEGGFVDWRAFGMAFTYLTAGIGLYEGSKCGIEKLAERRKKKKTIQEE